MKICVVQTRPVKGDIQANITNHKRLIDLAISHDAGTIIFPELSVTGYEPELANELAMGANDLRLDDFQEISDNKSITIGVGVPTKNDRGICISMIVFQPRKKRQIYSKKYLHEDELPFFVHGENTNALLGETNVALAICYELSVPQHAEDAVKSGAGIYIASAVKTKSGVEKSIQRLSEIARNYSLIVLLSNCIGISGGYDCDGRTSAWNNKGVLLGQLGEKKEGILIMDTETEEIIQKTLQEEIHHI